ncbi:Galactose mutarotase [Pustulibacterium marinum]|uniref:Galactose mutarotase n=1 Tax=Pustulibacterium marinum TaxID=1224947 RepID=A0A1I7FNK6_9FLAO|nr:aldose 1-epimerase family protein [Pustulibacterium marinum]SFU37787.1 Galactose mutarotase [Pustulibacterium marinum]
MKTPKKIALSNNSLSVIIKTEGAEISSIKNNDGTEFMWDANPDVWGSHAPVLFPIIGSLKDKHFLYKGEKYYTPKHGFIRHNENLKIEKQSEESVTFRYTYSKDSLSIYPFQFDFRITFTLTENTIQVHHKIENLGDETMYYSVGGHPAFKCPVYEEEAYTDYLIDFEKPETDVTYLLDNNGLQSGETAPMLNEDKVLRLQHDLFKDDALIFKNLKSKSVSLAHETKGPVVTVSYDDFDYLGIWAKTEGNFVCLEPWLGITDNAQTDGDFTTKEANQTLEPGGINEVSYSITIH